MQATGATRIDRVLTTLRDPRIDPAALRTLFARAQKQGDAVGSLVVGAALVLCIGIADEQFAGFVGAIDAVLAHLAALATIEDPCEQLLARAGELAARWFRSLADPALPALAESVVQAIGNSRIDVGVRCAAGIVAISYFEQLLDAEKVWWVELAMRDVAAVPRLSVRLADEWHVSLLRALYLCGETPRADQLREQRAALRLPSSAASAVKLALLDARIAIGEGRLQPGQDALRRAEPHLSPRAPMWAAHWHFFASRLALIEARLNDATNHARLSVRLCNEACSPATWAGIFVMQEAQVDVASGRFFAAVPIFERAAGSATGVQADYCHCLGHFARALGHTEAGRHDAARSALASGFGLVRELGWTAFFRANAKVAAHLCALALEHGIETDLVRAIITERQFESVRPDLAAWPWAIRIRTLGRFEIETGGAVLALRGKGARKPLELLQFVIASGGSDVAASGAMFALWPELEGDHAKSAFNVALHRLRKLLASDAAITLEFGKLSLGTQTVWVDSLAFEGLVDPLAPLLDDAQVRIARRALALYAGHFLNGDEEHAWISVHRSRLASKFKRLVRALARQALAHDDAAAARDLLERAVELEPLAEDLARELMQVLVRQGESAAALAVFERCKASLAMMLGTTPAASTCELAARLRAAPRPP